jgi:gamma-glutamyltranspeptidase / glutathione hydrolase
VNRDLGQTLRLIAPQGDAVFYEGEIAEAILDDMRRHDSLIAREDLRGWRTVRNVPLWGTYRGYRVSTNRPPGGGVLLLEMLNVLEQFPLAELEHNSAEYIRIVTETMKRATIDKDRHVGDPKFVDVPLDRLAGKEYAAALADEIRARRTADVPRFNVGGSVSRDTTHVSVIDADGNCVTMTHSLGMPSGVITPGLGFMYNGCMGVFDPRPGRVGSLAPGKSRFSSVVPSIVFEGDRPHIVIGAPGATQIAMGVLQVLLNAIDFGMTMVEAVSAARFSATSNMIDVSNRIPRGVQRQLEREGYQVVRSPKTYGFAAVHGIRVHPDGLDGGADPGHDGTVMAV